MPSSFIPQRIKRAKQQITVKLYQDQLAMLDSYGRFIDDSRDYIISQALETAVQKRQRIRTLGGAAEKCQPQSRTHGQPH